MFWTLFIGGLLLCHTIFAVQTWFMGYWAEQYDIYPPEQVNITLQVFHNFGNVFLLMAVGLTLASYLIVYGFMLLAMVVSFTMGYGVYVFGTLRASRSIHQKLIESVLGTTLRCVSSSWPMLPAPLLCRWLDTTPTSRVITRVTQDIRACMFFLPFS